MATLHRNLGKVSTLLYAGPVRLEKKDNIEGHYTNIFMGGMSQPLYRMSFVPGELAADIELAVRPDHVTKEEFQAIAKELEPPVGVFDGVFRVGKYWCEPALDFSKSTYFVHSDDDDGFPPSVGANTGIGAACLCLAMNLFDAIAHKRGAAERELAEQQIVAFVGKIR